MRGSRAPTRHSTLGQSLRCLSLRPCHARRRSCFCHLLGVSKVRASGMGSWGPGCCNPDRSTGALDDGCSRRPCDGSFRRKVSAASFTAGGQADRSASSSGLDDGRLARPSSSRRLTTVSRRCATAQKARRLRSERPSEAGAGWSGPTGLTRPVGRPLTSRLTHMFLSVRRCKPSPRHKASAATPDSLTASEPMIVRKGWTA
jgi:hypothetical protein